MNSYATPTARDLDARDLDPFYAQDRARALRSKTILHLAGLALKWGRRTITSGIAGVLRT